MFETVELGRKIGKEDYKEFEPTLRVGLLTVQYELRETDFPVIVLLAGNDGLGCTEVSNILHEWMDPRYWKRTSSRATARRSSSGRGSGATGGPCRHGGASACISESGPAGPWWSACSATSTTSSSMGEFATSRASNGRSRATALCW